MSQPSDSPSSSKPPNDLDIRWARWPEKEGDSNASGHVEIQTFDRTPYELIDADPHFKRVVRYMRPVDYATIAGFTVGVPIFFGGMMLFWPVPRVLGTPLVGAKFWRITTAIGFMNGFLVAYQNSCKRFWGWTENEREAKRDMAEMVGRLRAGEPLYGRSSMDEHHQRIAAGQSRYAQLKFPIFPFFNFANHTLHGVDPQKYYNALTEEDKEIIRKRFEDEINKGLEKIPTPKEDQQ